MTDYPTLKLNDDRRMPQLGFGTFKLQGSQCIEAVEGALATGYRLVDTAAVYENEAEVGEALGEAGDIFLQTKIWNSDQGYEPARAAANTSLARLGRDHVDMLLIHWPCPANDLFVDTWKVLIELRDAGKAKSIGVSNFRSEDLDRLFDATGELPALNQIELHPSFQQRELRRVHDNLGIVTQCWSPLGQGQGVEHETIERIAGETGKPAAAVVLAWHLQHGLAPIPKAGSRGHIEANFAALELRLTEAQMAAINALDSADGRIGPDPGDVN